MLTNYQVVVWKSLSWVSWRLHKLRVSVARKNNIRLGGLLDRHRAGDWGDLTADDLLANESAVKYKGRIFSSYTTKGGKFWIITEADRSATTVLLPEDY